MRLYILPVALTLCATCCGSHAGSKADGLVPAGFDDRGRYVTFTSDELLESVDNFPLARARWDGKPVKVLALFKPYVERLNMLNRNALIKPEQGYGCTNTVCDSLAYMFFAETSTRIDGMQNVQSPRLMMHFPTTQDYSEFIRVSSEPCTFLRSCQVWVKGPLRFFDAPVRTKIGDFTWSVVYVDVQEYRLFEGKELDAVRDAKQTLKTAVEIAPIAIKLFSALR